MAIDRYSGDYRILESVDEKGRIRSSTEYIGKDYVFTAGKKRAALRCSAALHTFGKVAVVLLVLGSLSGYAAFTASANQERQEKTAESVYAAQEDRAGEKAGEEAVSAEMEEERIDEEMETAD